MKTPVGDYLQKVLSVCQTNHQGQLADYIPQLANADPNVLALALSTIDGTIYSSGDDEVEFSIQSMSKPFAYALALMTHGLEQVSLKVGVEPSGEAFNQISLDDKKKIPKNPMINSGAITTHALLPYDEQVSRTEHLRQFLSQLAGRELSIDETVYESELKTAFRNLSIGYMLRTVGVLQQDPVEIVEGYIRQCAIKVTVKDLAQMAGVLANGGIQAKTGQRLISRTIVRQVLSVMMTCGMYDAAGDWLSTVGIPAKSGVAGGIIGILPAQVGIAVFSPKLDEHGNSVRGVEIFERLSQEMGLHLMEVTPSAQSIIQRQYQMQNHKDYVVQVYELRGTLQFAESEILLRRLAEMPKINSTEGSDAIVLDLTDLSLIHDVGRAMLLEGLDRLYADGYQVYIIDEEQILNATHTPKDKKIDYITQSRKMNL